MHLIFIPTLFENESDRYDEKDPWDPYRIKLDNEQIINYDCFSLLLEPGVSYSSQNKPSSINLELVVYFILNFFLMTTQ